MEACVRRRATAGLAALVCLAMVAQVATVWAAPDANRLDTPSETLKKAGAVIKDLATGDVRALRRGPLLIHGHFCGIGGRPGSSPVDALDAACMRHDACTKTGSLPSCTCDERLMREATTIAHDPASTADLKALATATAASMAILVCD